MTTELGIKAGETLSYYQQDYILEEALEKDRLSHLLAQSSSPSLGYSKED